MKVYWLSILPLAGALVVALLRRWRVPMLIVALVTLVGCLRLSSALPLDQAAAFLGQHWVLDGSAQRLLTLAYWTTAILLVIAAADPKADGVHAPLLVSLGLLSAAVVLRSWLLSLLLLPAALILPILATLPARRSSPRGAAQFLAWTTLPVPFLLAIPWLLDQLVVRPQELAVVTWSAWLVLPAWIFWLNLFPFHGATPQWAAEDLPLAPAFLWTAKDAVVLYLLLTLWRQMPALQTESMLSTLRTLGLLTALFSGVWAVIQSSLSGVLGCAAMAVLGLVVQGVATGSTDGLSAAIFLLLSRSAAVLLVGSALTALYSGSAGKPRESHKQLPLESAGEPGAVASRTLQADHSPRQLQRRTVVRREPGREAEARSSPLAESPWQGILLWLICVAGVLALLRLPGIDNPASDQSVLAGLQLQEPRLAQAWRISSAGVLIGLAHTSWRLWHDQVRSSASRIRLVPFLLAVCLLLLCLHLALSPQIVASWIAGLTL